MGGRTKRSLGRSHCARLIVAKRVDITRDARVMSEVFETSTLHFSTHFSTHCSTHFSTPSSPKGSASRCHHVHHANMPGAVVWPQLHNSTASNVSLTWLRPGAEAQYGYLSAAAQLAQNPISFCNWKLYSFKFGLLNLYLFLSVV